eukprot:c36471_g1_i1 orf=3-338(+)
MSYGYFCICLRKPLFKLSFLSLSIWSEDLYIITPSSSYEKHVLWVLLPWRKIKQSIRKANAAGACNLHAGIHNDVAMQATTPFMVYRKAYVCKSLYIDLIDDLVLLFLSIS